MTKWTFGVLVLALGAARVEAEVVFQCDIGPKQILLTQQGEMISYHFGPAAAPELTISAAARDLNYLPWDGMGSSMPEMVQFQNAGTIYEVWYSVQKQMDENAPLPPTEGGVRVIKGDQTLADLPCSTPPNVYDLERIYDAKLAAGQCYDWADQSWKVKCDP